MEDLTKYERARIIGARALQISMGAPMFVDKGEEMSPIEIAKMEFKEDVLPITIRRELPKKKVQVAKPEEKKEESAEETAENEEKPEGEENKSKEA